MAPRRRRFGLGAPARWHASVNLSDLTAFVLVGGRSSRMGADKALLPLGQRTLVERALELAGAVTPQVRLVGPLQALRRFGTVVEDVYEGCGPLGGIHAALTATETELNLVLAVDLPFLQPAFLRALAAEARRAPALATVPQAAGGLQPLCAVYRKAFAAPAGRALEAGEYKIDRLFTPAVAHIVRVGPEEPGFAFPAQMFDNLNTRDELERAQETFRRRRL